MDAPRRYKKREKNWSELHSTIHESAAQIQDTLKSAPSVSAVSIADDDNPVTEQLKVCSKHLGRNQQLHQNVQ